MRPSIEGLQQLNIIFTRKRYFLSLDLYMKKHYNCNWLVLYGSLTTDATLSPEPITDLINNTTAMPAVLWTDWMNSSKDRKRNRVETNQWKKTYSMFINQLSFTCIATVCVCVVLW